MKLLTLFSSITFILLIGCAKQEADLDAKLADFENRLKYLEAKDPEIRSQLQIEDIKKRFPTALSTESGLHYIVVENGEGETPKPGATVTAHYEGTLLDGTTFDSSYKRGEPFQFPVGYGRVIKGWDQAFLAMKKGEKRKLIIPSKLAYGDRAAGSIPPGSILVFDVELIDFE